MNILVYHEIVKIFVALNTYLGSRSAAENIP